LIFGAGVPGYASLLVAVLFFGSLQLVGIGLVGEYVGRIYIETKQRPRYVIRRQHEMSCGGHSLDAHRELADRSKAGKQE
jgi:hypothetical protein